MKFAVQAQQQQQEQQQHQQEAPDHLLQEVEILTGKLFHSL